MFITRLTKDGNKYTLFHERYDLCEEKKEIMSQADFTLPDKVTCDVIKYIMKREFSAPITWLDVEAATDYVRDFDVALIFRNDGASNNETFGFEIRAGMDLSKVRFAREKHDWIDVGGRKNWRKYAFPTFKFSVEEAQEELSLSQEIVMICPFVTIALGKKNDGSFQILSDLSSEKNEILDKWRKTMEQSASLKYRSIKSNVYTDNLSYTIQLPFLDKISTAHIFNDLDCRSIFFLD